MPAAIESSKRKFNKLLDSLSSGPTQYRDFANSSGQRTSEAKRRRLSSAPETAPEQRSNAPVSPTVRVVPDNSGSAVDLLPIHPTAKHSSAAQVKELPNYCPWSHVGFLQRLSTFADLTRWTPHKPAGLSEVQWARYGWTLDTKPTTSPNTVACRGGCEARVVVSLRRQRKDKEGNDIEGTEDWTEEIDDAMETELVRRYQALMLDGHGENCLWRTQGVCGQDIYRMPIARPSVWQPELKSRYASFIRFAEAVLPSIDQLECPVNLDTIVQQLGTDFLEIEPALPPNKSKRDEPVDDRTQIGVTTSPAMASDTEARPTATSMPTSHRTALAFALLGWHATSSSVDTSSSYATATCSHCFRRIPLWLYAVSSIQLSKDATSPDSAPSAMKLDLASNHRPYCPWINGESQAMPGRFEGLAGWTVLTHVIASFAGFRARSRVGNASNVNSESATERNTRGISQLSESTENETRVAATNGTSEDLLSDGPSLSKSREQIEREDKERFRRVKELARTFGVRVKGKLSDRDKGKNLSSGK